MSKELGETVRGVLPFFHFARLKHEPLFERVLVLYDVSVTSQPSAFWGETLSAGKLSDYR